jgi:2,4-dienoyl-CoA reductase-like NADH-dependent reductase (Old Yellow Enzyme family)/thioredoxin reductase
MQLRNRIMLPPHGRLVGDPFGSDAAAARHAAYWERRSRSGAAWICGLNVFIDNQVVIPGFEPSGLGATERGPARRPGFGARVRRYVDAVHAGGAVASAQLILQGGMPHSPSGLLANHADNQVPHVLDAREIAHLVAEYGHTAAELAATGLDGIELHANHEDLLQLFLSPATNHRDDAYGGSFEARLSLVAEILEVVRANAPACTVGLRLNADELFEGGYDLEGGIRIATALEARGLVDYVHCVVGNNWGDPSYVQTHHHRPAAWSWMAARYREALAVPVIYSGRVDDPGVAATIVDQGHADVVGMARAMFADGDLVEKAASGRLHEIRPCIGTNDCLHRVVVEGLRFGCSVNPAAGREQDGPLPSVEAPARLLVVGAGPAGLELAALAAERGHEVEIWEREPEIGGQVRVAARAPENARYADYLAYQHRRLTDLGVRLRLGAPATRASVLAAGHDVVAVATGARPRRPAVPGVELPHVVEGRAVLLGEARVHGRVVVLAMEDHMQPLTIAGFLASQGNDVTLVYATRTVGALVGKYSIGAPLAKLSAAGGEVEVLHRAVAILPDAVHLQHVYSGRPRTLEGVDGVVLACGGVAESTLYHELRDADVDVHVLGDAYAPRRISFATRQAYELAARL